MKPIGEPAPANRPAGQGGPARPFATSAAGKPGLVRRTTRWIIRGLRSIRFAVILMALIAVACLVGTLIVQEPYNPDKAISHYGRALGLLVGLLGLNHLYGAWWFVGLLFLLALSVTTCAFSGLRFTLRKLYTLIAHASILLIVAGAIVRALAGIDGMLTIEKGQAAEAFQVENDTIPPSFQSVSLGFKLRLDDFVIGYYDDARESLEVKLDDTGRTLSIPVEIGKVVHLRPDGTSIEILRRLLDFKLDDKGQVYSASDQPENPALQVRLTGPSGESKRWVFALHPEFQGHAPGAAALNLKYLLRPGTIKSYESHVTVLDEADKEIRKGVILVNSPLKVGRYTFYQFGYDPKTLASSNLEVTSDPGVPLVFAGFILLPIGIALALYAKPLLNRGGAK